MKKEISLDNVYVIEFSLRERVRIKELNREGTINGIFIGNTGTEYRVRYFDNADLKEVYFTGEEIEKIK